MIDPVELLEELVRVDSVNPAMAGRDLTDRDGLHPLLGPALLTPAVICGGVAPNVVPDRCRSGVGGVPCVVLGPGSIDQAHTDDEWVPLGEVRRGRSSTPRWHGALSDTTLSGGRRGDR
jgi:hypothetical protein